MLPVDQSIEGRFEHVRELVMDRMLPQECQIMRPTHAVDDQGMQMADTFIAVEYRGSTRIPCRIDLSRHYRQAEPFGQEVIVSDGTLNVPLGVSILAGDVAYIDAVGVLVKYEIRKVYNSHAWDVVHQALLVRVDDNIV